VGEADRRWREVADGARAYGVRLGERVIERYGLEIGDEQVDGAVAEVTREILQRVREMHRDGMPTALAVEWGHACVNGLQDRILEHTGYLLMGAALVAFDPSTATRP
jgi:hypothetical protein